jgi:hypothetical protein
MGVLDELCESDSPKVRCRLLLTVRDYVHTLCMLAPDGLTSFHS